MRLLTTVLVLVSLTMASSRGYSMRQPNDLTVNKKLPNDVRTAVHDHDPTEPVIVKKAAVEAATPIATAILGILREIEVIDSRIMNAVIDLTLTLPKALKAAAFEFIKTFARKAMFLFAELPIDCATGLMESPLFDVAMDILLPFSSDEQSRKDCLNVEDTGRGQLYTNTGLSKK
ncbi:uncharacterized protein LOC143357057 [Halictus rubicundus]|uniref:uncharacterized protein LOC143357057 n=1 Tax=Halictus rubicundus TaxID=77578 RepID=UPI0040364369